ACTFNGSRLSVVRPELGLIFVNPQLGWPDVIGKVEGPAIVDITGGSDVGRARELIAEALRWTKRNNVAPVVVFVPLACAQAVPDGMLTWPLDWPFLRSAAGSGIEHSSRGSRGQIEAVVVDDDRLAGLARARQSLRTASQTTADRSWPPVLANAARLARLLVDLPVACDTFDAHVVHAVGRT